jgi:hypothetical protein
MKWPLRRRPGASEFACDLYVARATFESGSHGIVGGSFRPELKSLVDPGI